MDEKAGNGSLVNHKTAINPAHYKSGRLQVIHVTEAFRLSSHLSQAVSYLLRAGKKPGEPKAKDLEKAIWYIMREYLLDNGRLPEVKMEAERVGFWDDVPAAHSIVEINLEEGD